MHLEKGRWDDRSVRLWCPCSEPHHLPLQVLLHTVSQLWVGGAILETKKGESLVSVPLPIEVKPDSC